MKHNLFPFTKKKKKRNPIITCIIKKKKKKKFQWNPHNFHLYFIPSQMS